MKLYSRSGFGVAVGLLSILLYVAITIFLIDLLVKIDSIEDKRYERGNVLGLSRTVAIILIAVCLILTIVDGLLIMGIVKRLYKLMMPWLVLSLIGFVFHCGQFILGTISAIASHTPFSWIFLMMIVNIATIGISWVILRAMYILYCDIRNDNLDKPVAAMPYRRHETA